MNLLACTPIPQNTPPISKAQTSTSSSANLGSEDILSSQELNEKAEIFTLMLMAKDTEGLMNPVTPEQLGFLKIDNQTIKMDQILLAGSSDATAFTNERSFQRKVTQVIRNQQPWVIYGDQAIYTLVLPKSGNNTSLVFQLKDDEQRYELIRLPGMNQGTFIAESGQLEGAFNLLAPFEIQNHILQYGLVETLIAVVLIDSLTSTGAPLPDGFEPAEPIDSPDPNPTPKPSPTPKPTPPPLDPQQFPSLAHKDIYQLRADYYALTHYDVNSYSNYYQSTEGQATITTQNHQQIVYRFGDIKKPLSKGSVSTLTRQGIQTAIQTKVDDHISPLQRYVGSWEAENQTLLSSLLGEKILVNIRKKSSDIFKLTAAINKDRYAGEGTHNYNQEHPDHPLQITIQSETGTIVIKFRLVKANQLGITLIKTSEGFPQLTPLLGQELLFKRDFYLTK